MSAWRVWPCIAAAAILAGCPTPPLPAGNLADPTALVHAMSVNQNLPGFGGSTFPADLVFIAEGDGQDLRAFEPVGTVHLFVRGPNDISALSIPLSTTLGSTTLPSFRAVRLAAGMSPPSMEFPVGRGYVVAAGTASRLAVIDTQYPGPEVNAQPTFPTTVSADDLTKCTTQPAPLTSVSCLPQPALDVVANGASVFALLAPDPVTAAQSIVVMTAGDEVQKDGNTMTVLSIAAAGPALIPLPAGQFQRLTFASIPRADSTGAVSNHSYLFLADMAPTTAAGVLRVDVTSIGSTPPPVLALPTPGPVRVAVAVPPYPASTAGLMMPENASAANGDLVLAVLANGMIETIDAETALPAVDGAGFPILPTSFGAPAEDIVFMACWGTPCNVEIRTGTTTLAYPSPPYAAFVALGDGTAAPLVPNLTSPQVLQPVPLTTTDPSTTVPVFYPLPAYGSAPVAMSTPTNFTLGYTRSEEVTAEFNGTLPGFAGRPAAFAEGPDGGFILSDPEALGSAPVVYPDIGPAPDGGSVCVFGSGTSYNPLNCAYPLIGDRIRLQSTDGTNCPNFGTAEVSVDGYGPGTLILGPANPPLPCVPREIAYDAIAAAEPAGGMMPAPMPAAIGAWTVFGSASGYMGRASTVNYLVAAPELDGGEGDAGFVDGGPLEFEYFGEPFFYPQNDFQDGPSGSVALTFTISDTGSTTPLGESDIISFSIANGFGPLVYSSTASVSGLTESVAVVNQTLYMAVEGADSLTEIAIPSYTLTNSVNDYR